MTSKISLFFYKNVLDLTVFEGTLENLPMFRRDIKAFKGVDNFIDIKVNNSDRKPVKLLAGGEIKMKIFDVETNELLLTKYAEIIDEAKGRYKFKITRNETAMWSPGFYRYSFMFTNFEGDDQMLYTDLSQGIIGEIEVVADGFERHQPAAELIFEEFVYQQKYQYTSRVKGNAQKAVNPSTQTASVYLDNFTGKFWIQASLEEYPTLDEHFFSIDISEDPDEDVDYYLFEEYTGLMNFMFEGNFTWIRFKLEPDTDVEDSGKIEKILLK